MNRDETFLVQNHARNVPILRIVDESEGVYIEREKLSGKDSRDWRSSCCSSLRMRSRLRSKNSSKGDKNDVRIFSDNAKVTIYEFLNSAEIAYMGWVNSVQRADTLYNHHLLEEIKSKLIIKSVVDSAVL